MTEEYYEEQPTVPADYIEANDEKGAEKLVFLKSELGKFTVRLENFLDNEYYIDHMIIREYGGAVCVVMRVIDDTGNKFNRDIRLYADGLVYTQMEKRSSGIESAIVQSIISVVNALEASGVEYDACRWDNSRQLIWRGMRDHYEHGRMLEFTRPY